MLSATSCAPSTPLKVTEPVYLFEPEIYQHCRSRPLPPPKGATEGQWKNYILDLRRWGADCESKVNGGRAWQERKQLELNATANH